MAASIYVTQFTATKQKEFNNLLTIGNGDNSKEVVFSVNEQDSRQIYDTITKALDKYNGNMYSISVDNNNFTKYVYCNDVELFNNICLSDGRFFESDEKNSSLFLSTLKSNDIIAAILCSLVAEAIMICGYFLFDLILYKSIETGLAGMPGNLLQAAFGFICSIVLYKVLASNKYISKHMNF